MKPKNKTMKKFSILAIILLITTLSVVAQKKPMNTDTFKHPVLVKLVQGDGNIFRIGFLRYSDFHDIKEEAGNPNNIYANFMEMVEFTDKYFVYFPFSLENGEMTIVNKNDVIKLDMRYEQAMKLIRPSLE